MHLRPALTTPSNQLQCNALIAFVRPPPPSDSLFATGTTHLLAILTKILPAPVSSPFERKTFTISVLGMPATGETDPGSAIQCSPTLRSASTRGARRVAMRSVFREILQRRYNKYVVGEGLLILPQICKLRLTRKTCVALGLVGVDRPSSSYEGRVD